ncbi:hypothetical protein AB6N23_13870 [Cellulomonas sp. 179-A 9B4 NHS]|uniref:hypothetical protein n=1 Tax=Cellulomonas sp. 179-A 9B4 NHS TaxID=3142379 RepID=UPI0039A0766F
MTTTEARVEELQDPRAVLDRLATVVRERAGDAATVEVSTVSAGVAVLEVRPHRADSCAVTVVAEQWLVVCVGAVGGRFELDWEAADVTEAEEILDAAIAGRVVERHGLVWSRVTVTTRDGTERASETIRFRGLLPTLGRRRRYAPYRA